MSSKSHEQRTGETPYVRKINLNNNNKKIEKKPKDCVLSTKKQPKLLFSKVNRNKKIVNKFTKYPVPMEIDDPAEYALYRSWDPMDLDD
jgi:hypothetical protein